MYREVAAYVLDKESGEHAAGVPETCLAKLHASELEGKVGSLQAYVRNARPAEEFGRFCEYSAEEVQRIAILDIRICNMDRHEGNLLVNKINGEDKYHLT